MREGSVRAFTRVYGHSPRPVVAEALKLIDEGLEEGEGFLLVLSAPTGYGKSCCTAAIAEAHARLGGPIERLIHVLPLRSIVEDLYRKAESARSRGALGVTTGAQAMHLLDVAKCPYLLPRLTYTTLDSFVHSLFKRPVREVDRLYSHFDVPRYAIYSSMVVFDEAHLYAGDEPRGASRMFTAFLAALEALTSAAVPVVVMTATLPSSYYDKLINSCLRVRVILVDFDPSADGLLMDELPLRFGRRALRVRVGDPSFALQAKLSNPSIGGFIDEGQLIPIVARLAAEGRSVLIVRNTVLKAVRVYEELTKLKVADCYLLHSRMTTSDRFESLKSVEEALERGRPAVLVSTQVVEAGVDLSFDALITDAAPISSIVQRVGRVSRRPCSRPGLIYIVEGDGDGVYDPSIVKLSVDKLKRSGGVMWRLPKGVNGAVGFREILDQVEDRPPNVDERVKECLLDLDRYVEADIHAWWLLRTLCSFVRDEGLVTVSSGVDEGASWHDVHRTLMPLSLNYLAERWQEILDVNDEGVAVLVMKQGRAAIVRSRRALEALKSLTRGPCELINRLDEALTSLRREGVPIALTLRRGVYRRRVGLVE